VPAGLHPRHYGRTRFDGQVGPGRAEIRVAAGAGLAGRKYTVDACPEEADPGPGHPRSRLPRRPGRPDPPVGRGRRPRRHAGDRPASRGRARWPAAINPASAPARLCHPCIRAPPEAQHAHHRQAAGRWLGAENAFPWAILVSFGPTPRERPGRVISQPQQARRGAAHPARARFYFFFFFLVVTAFAAPRGGQRAGETGSTTRPAARVAAFGSLANGISAAWVPPHRSKLRGPPSRSRVTAGSTESPPVTGAPGGQSGIAHDGSPVHGPWARILVRCGLARQARRARPGASRAEAEPQRAGREAGCDEQLGVIHLPDRPAAVVDSSRWA